MVRAEKTGNSTTDTRLNSATIQAVRGSTLSDPTRGAAGARSFRQKKKTHGRISNHTNSDRLWLENVDFLLVEVPVTLTSASASSVLFASSVSSGVPCQKHGRGGDTKDTHGVPLVLDFAVIPVHHLQRKVKWFKSHHVHPLPLYSCAKAEFG